MKRIACDKKTIGLLRLFILVATFGLAYAQEELQQTHITPFQEKEWTFIVYMAADNDLRGFAARNIKQMAAVGSTDFVNILVHLDIKISGNKKITRRYFIEKNRILQVNVDDPASQKMDSGDPQTLISCCSWAISEYPAKHYALVLWNHGTGPLDPANGRIIHPTELFTFNPTLNKFELDRSIGFLDYVNSFQADDKGICWDDSTGNYLTNQKLAGALECICQTCLNGNKLDLIGFDACLMSTIEIANLVKPYADIMVGSQEVELGTGWNYQKILAPLQYSSLDTDCIAQHIVQVFGATYNSITDEYTLSAINLNTITPLELNIDTVAKLLIHALQNQKGNSVQQLIQVSASKAECTYFDEPSYLDLYHLYSNLLNRVSLIRLTTEAETLSIKQLLSDALHKGKELIRESVIDNITGKNLMLAHGLSIYFPDRRIHYSYKKTPFATQNSWYDFLLYYLSLQ